jgi:hypothetical protein
MNNHTQIQDNYFFCYSPNLYKHLKYNNNISYITKGINPSTKKTFWIFEKTDHLKQILNHWSLDKSK